MPNDGVQWTLDVHLKSAVLGGAYQTYGLRYVARELISTTVGRLSYRCWLSTSVVEVRSTPVKALFNLFELAEVNSLSNFEKTPARRLSPTSVSSTSRRRCGHTA